MRYEKKSFQDADIELDDNEFIGCTFENCTFIYHGGTRPLLSGNSFGNPRLNFEGAAGNTVLFLTALYHGGFKPIIDDTINNIRGNSNPRSEGITIN